jgi:hypothetical protein
MRRSCSCSRFWASPSSTSFGPNWILAGDFGNCFLAARDMYNGQPIDQVRCWLEPSDTTAPDSLLASINGGCSANVIEPIRLGNLDGLLTRPYHYIRNGDGREELYNVVDDPVEANDLAASAVGEKVLPQLRAALSRRLPPGLPPHRGLKDR